MSEILREWQEIYEKGEKKPGVVFIEKPGFAVYKDKSFISQFDDLAVEGDLENVAKNCPLTQII